MKRYLLWSFERGSPQYDVICAVIVAFIFLTPPAAFNDRPDFMLVRGSDAVRKSQDDNGNPVYTVKVETALFTAEEARRQAVEKRLQQAVNRPLNVSKMLRIDDAIGIARAYAIWIEN